jgi:single-stranded-DNA-specific exonuclease
MGFDADVQEVAGRISEATSATVISHIDADGITGEAILCQALARAGIAVSSVFVRQLEPMAMRHVPQDSSLKIFVDLGAGQQNLIEEHGLGKTDVVIIDHHISQDVGTPYLRVNAVEHGFDKLSAAGVAYLVAREIDESNVDLARLAVIGNVGDMMAREHCGLVGPARSIVDEGEAGGYIEVNRRDLNCYGLSTRPLHICLAYSDDPHIPGISNNPRGAVHFLENLDLTLRDGYGKWRVWEEFDIDERRTVISALIQQIIAHGESINRLLGETYFFPDEPGRTPLRNASEYATLLNACGRWAKPAIGGSICRGDRGDAYREAEYMLRHHRGIIRELVQYILDHTVTELSHLQFIHVGNRFPDTIIGIGAGIALPKLNWKKPIMILCYLPDDPELVKVSMRTNERVLQRGIDLQGALITASEEVGGAGGGHKIAAGAYIPKQGEMEFVHHVNATIKEQCTQARSNDR